MNTENTTRQSLRKLITDFTRVDDLRDDTDIFSTGMVNSLFAMQLVLFMEKNFDLTVENDELDLDSFRSIDAMVAYVTRKKDTEAALQ